MKKIAFHTMGCKVNQFDTALMDEQMQAADYRRVPFDESADLYVINTCSVTEKSDQESRRMIRRAKRINPKAKVVVTGCYAQTHPEELAKIKEIDLILGNGEKQELADVLGRCDEETGPVLNVGKFSDRTALSQPLIHRMAGHTRVFIKIQDGCDYLCSFCLIPSARGPGRSLPMEQVVEQIDLLVEEGCKEVVITGVNLGTYGRDFMPKQTLAALLALLLERTRIPRIRLSSIEPKTVSPELIELMASSPRICRHFHIPLQSGDDGILKKMTRHYSQNYYRNLILTLAKQFPNAGFGCDVMVGFPGETQTQWQNTTNLLRDLPMTYFHVFPYSSRPGTSAERMADEVAEPEKARRAQELRQLAVEKGRLFAEAQRGRVMEVLVEKERDSASGMLRGVGDNYLKVFFPGPDSLKNRILQVQIEEFTERGVRAGLSIRKPQEFVVKVK